MPIGIKKNNCPQTIAPPQKQLLSLKTIAPKRYSCKTKKGATLAGHSLSNIMYEKKISCFQDEVYVL